MKIEFKTALRFLLVLLALSVLFYSCKDDFTEEDLLNKQAELAKDNVELAVLVYNASTSFGVGVTNSGGRTSSEKGLGSLDVTISLNGTPTTVQTDAAGLANFTGLSAGTVSGVVSGAGFTTTNFVVSIKNQESATAGAIGSTINAGVLVPVYETAGPNTTTVSGSVTCDTNLLNNVKENVPDGVTISFSITPKALQYEYYEYYEEYYPIFGNNTEPLLESLQNARVESISFEGNFVATVTGGQYSIVLPTAQDGLYYSVQFSDFTANQNIAVDSYNNDPIGSIRDVQTISTLFTQSTWDDVGANYYQYSIPSVSPIQFDIAAPPTAGTGAAVNASLLPQTFASSFTILNPGSGFTPSLTDIPVTVNGGNWDSTVPGALQATLFATSNANGQIIAVGVGATGTLGFGYRTQGTVSIGGSGTGAVVRVNYSSTVAPPTGVVVTGTSGTTIASGGTGYFLAPDVHFRGVNDLGVAVEGSATGEVVFNGALVNFTPPGTAFASLNSVTIIPVNRTQESILSYSVNSSGALTGISSAGVGTGYTPGSPPALVIRDLRGLGTGASILTSVSAAGTIDALNILTGGTQYSTLGNANYPTGPRNFEFHGDNPNGSVEYPYTVVVLQPGSNRILNAYYGTGIHALELYIP